jgi:hypothetical protein
VNDCNPHCDCKLTSIEMLIIEYHIENLYHSVSMQSPLLSQSPLQPYCSLLGAQQSSQQNFTKVNPCPLNALMEQAVVNQNRTVVTAVCEDREGVEEDIVITSETLSSEGRWRCKHDVVFYTVSTLTVEELDIVSIFYILTS